MCVTRRPHTDIRTRRYARTNEHTTDVPAYKRCYLTSTFCLLRFYLTFMSRRTYQCVHLYFDFSLHMIHLKRIKDIWAHGHTDALTYQLTYMRIYRHANIQIFLPGRIITWCAGFRQPAKLDLYTWRQHNVFHCIIANRGIQSRAFLGLGRPAR